MGKEGGYWGGGRSLRRTERETPSGCISSFFHFFDFHPFHFSFQHHNNQTQQQQPSSFNLDHTTTTSIPKGTEAPRNSLKSEDRTIMVVGSSVSTKQGTLEIPKKNKLFIKTSTGIISSNSKVGNIVNDNLSPGTRTPTLLARLMGLDLLPDAQSPSSSSPSSSSTTTSSCLSATKSQVNLHPQHHHHHLRPRQHHNVVITKPRHSMDDSIVASRLLSDTPRISSARISDVEHRPSLQINKENMGVGGEDLGLPRFSFSKLKFEEQHSGNRSPRQYAKQIVKQVRESGLMNRKVGTDVTNTVKNKERGGGSEIFVGHFRCKKSPRTTPTCSSSDELRSSPGKVSNNRPSCSPRLRFMDPESMISTVTTTEKDQITPQPLVKFANKQPQVVSKAILVEQEAHQQFQKQKSSSVPKCKKAANEKFSPLLKKPNNVRNKQDESFVRPLLSSTSDKESTSGISKRSSQPLLINLLNLNSAVQHTNSNITPPPAPAATTKIPQKQTEACVAREAEYCCSSQSSSGSSQTHTSKEEATSPPCITLSATTVESNVDELDKRKISVYGSMFNNGPEFEYVSSILCRTGFAVKKGTTKTNSSTVSVSLFHQWLSPTQPLDPSIFHHLEQQFQNQNQNHQNQKNYPTCDASSASSQDRSLRPKYDVGVRCNRRLLFDLVNEILSEVVGTCDEEAVWERIGRLKIDKKCEFLEDIDALIEMEDLGKTIMKMESAGPMVAEIEGNMMDTLLHETVMMVTECVAGAAGGDDVGTERTTTTPFSKARACHVSGSRDGLYFSGACGATIEP